MIIRNMNATDLIAWSNNLCQHINGNTIYLSIILSPPLSLSIAGISHYNTIIIHVNTLTKE